MGTILKDRVALVTGAVGGIGRSISLHLAAEGAILALNYLVERDEDAEEYLKELTRQGFRASLYKADVSRSDEAVSLVERVTKDFGRIDVLINNAGITIDKAMKNMSPDQWDKVIGVDLSSVFYCSRAVIGQMLERGYGRIINISSVVGQKGNFGQTNYAAAKAGIIGFTKALALETAKKGITVNAIAPGFIETDMTRSLPDQVKTGYLGLIPAGRWGTAAEVAETVAFLASPLAGYITGQVINVNGGMYG